MWLVIGLCAVFVAFLIHGLIQQERCRLWKDYQEELAEKQRAEMEKQKRAAADKIKEMLRQRRSANFGNEGDAPSEGQPAPAEPAAENAASRA
jgi:FtsZ-interacting cell division protein ZipA